MWVEIKPDYKKSFFVYRPPKSLIDWVDDFEKEIRVAMTMNSDITIMGDFSIEKCEWKIFLMEDIFEHLR